MLVSLSKFFNCSINYSLLFKETFLSQHYQKHNIARLSHLDSLELNLSNKTVLEFGAGIGDHTYYYLIKNCKVTSTDARKEQLEFIQTRFGNDTLEINIEKDIPKIIKLPEFDIIHCYGVLYHISNPGEFLDALKGKCKLLLLETCVSSDENQDNINLIKEDKKKNTQSFSGAGCRPTRNWIYEQLKSIFPFVYIPTSQPNHPEFPKNWNVTFDERKLKRAVFIASESIIESDKLVDFLPQVYQ